MPTMYVLEAGLYIYQLIINGTPPSSSSLLQALEPYISEEIMKLHHTKHHQAYVNGLNAAEEAYEKTDSITKRIGLQSALKFNGGGVYFVHTS